MTGRALGSTSLVIVVPLVSITASVKAKDMLYANYLRRGWIEIDPDNQ